MKTLTTFLVLTAFLAGCGSATIKRSESDTVPKTSESSPLPADEEAPSLAPGIATPTPSPEPVGVATPTSAMDGQMDRMTHYDLFHSNNRR